MNIVANAASALLDFMRKDLSTINHSFVDLAYILRNYDKEYKNMLDNLPIMYEHISDISVAYYAILRVRNNSVTTMTTYSTNNSISEFDIESIDAYTLINLYDKVKSGFKLTKTLK